MTRFASVAGVRLAYEAAGAGDPPMVFVHGWCCARSYFAPQFAHFSASHAVAAVDLRGHGESDSPAPGPGAYDVAVLAQDVLAVAAAAGLGQPVLVGHSLGALAGLVCAARPGAIRALVMVDPAPITNEQAKAFFRDPVAAIRADGDRSWRTAFVKGMLLPTDAARRQAIVESFPATAPGIAADAHAVHGDGRGVPHGCHEWPAVLVGGDPVEVERHARPAPAPSHWRLRPTCCPGRCGTGGSGTTRIPSRRRARAVAFKHVDERVTLVESTGPGVADG